MSEQESHNPDQQEGLAEDFISQVKKWSDEAEASRKEGRQLGLGIPDEEEVSEEELKAAVLESQQNPDESHRLYYAVQRILIDNLPPGDGDNEKLRRVVYDEKNLYINRGHDLDKDGIRGSDGRMGYLPHLRASLSLVKKWASEMGSAFDIFLVFWELNEELGYHKGSKAKKEKPLKIHGTLDDVLRAAVKDKPKNEG